jgi:predicted dehydrogenase
MKQELNVGVIGCGYWGPNLIRNFRSVRDCRMRLVCDRDEKRLDHMREIYPEVETVQDLSFLAGRPEIHAVVVATPVHTHHAFAKAALEAGKHVLIEKPMASSVAECEELIAIARARGLTLMVGHTFLFSPPVRRIKEIIDHGDIGEIRYISSRRLNLGLFQKDINVAWDLAPHDISIILYLMNQHPVAVNCTGKANVTRGIEDVTNMTLTFSGGGYATIHNSWLDPKKVREMTIVGSRRMIVYDDLEPLQKLKIYDERVERPPHYDTFAEFQYSYHYGDMYAPYIKQEEPLKIQCQHFVDCIRNGTRPLTDGEHGLELVRILEASSRSISENGCRIEIGGGTGTEAAAPKPRRRRSDLAAQGQG